MSPRDAVLESAASRVCLACGLCCDGTLFQVVRLQPSDDVKALSKLGLSIYRKKKEPYFPQPCEMLRDCCCTIYEQRPERCRRYECRLIAGLKQGALSEPAALEHVAHAKQLAAAEPGAQGALEDYLTEHFR